MGLDLLSVKEAQNSGLTAEIVPKSWGCCVLERVSPRKLGLLPDYCQKLGLVAA